VAVHSVPGERLLPGFAWQQLARSVYAAL
jgi:hypothetical protein